FATKEPPRKAGGRVPRESLTHCPFTPYVKTDPRHHPGAAHPALRGRAASPEATRRAAVSVPRAAAGPGDHCPPAPHDPTSGRGRASAACNVLRARGRCRMKAAPLSRRDRVRAMLADLKMPGALEALDGILHGIDGGSLTAGEAIESLLGAQIDLRNNRRLQAAMRSSRLPAVKQLADFDFSFQPSIRREQLESLHELGFIERKENVVFLGPPGVGKS